MPINAKIMSLYILIYVTSLVFGLAYSYDDYNFQYNQSNLTQNAPSDMIYLQHAVKGSKVCMGDIGCFELTKDFYHPLYRPFNFLPFDRSKINTRFYLYTRSNPKDSWNLSASDKKNMKRSPLYASAPTVFIVHGFLDTKLYVKWMEDLKDNLLLYKDHNVIIVDWSGGNFPPYTQATANTRVVGAEIALLIETLKEVKGVSYKDCHIIGHSLGAHIAGYTGERINKIGRISAVDPAEPFFQYMPSSVRLDRSDAEFVDVIHTDSTTILLLGLGMSQAIGHVDFYPNDGTKQPGCKTEVVKSIFLDGLVEATRRFVSCNHQRAVDFYTHSINYRRAPPLSYACPTWKDYTKGNCADCGVNNTKCAVMGIRAYEYFPVKNDSHSLKLYVSTSGTVPYWVSHYQVTVKLAKPSNVAAKRKGKMALTLKGIHGEFQTDLSALSMPLEHGKTYKFLVASEKILGPIQAVLFSWKDYSWNFFGTKTITLDYIRIRAMNFIDETERGMNDKVFCNNPSNVIKSGASVTLHNSCGKDVKQNIV